MATEKGQTKTPATTLRLVTVMLGVIIAETICLVWFLYPVGLDESGPGIPVPFEESVNFVQQKYPDVDFTRIYPDMTPEEIDLLQRECLNVRYIYEPFVQFVIAPQQRRFVTVTAHGYRKGWRDQPWPPNPDDFVIFVFGGSTTFSYYLPDAQTVPVMIERALANVMPQVKVQCYNFGQGYYFSTQERIFFESILLQGIIPEVAIFIDGLNEFYFPDGRPEYTEALDQLTAPDLPRTPDPPLNTDADKTLAVERIVNRYEQNVNMIDVLAKSYGVTPVFVGQPVPFWDYDIDPNTYPFPATFPGHELCAWGYDRFKQAGLAGSFGKHFIWCGDAFTKTDSIVYADSIHYSKNGAQLLAEVIVRRALEMKIIPPDASRSNNKSQMP